MPHHICVGESGKNSFRSILFTASFLRSWPKTHLPWAKCHLTANNVWEHPGKEQRTSEGHWRPLAVHGSWINKHYPGLRNNTESVLTYRDRKKLMDSLCSLPAPVQELQSSLLPANWRSGLKKIQELALCSSIYLALCVWMFAMCKCTATYTVMCIRPLIDISTTTVRKRIMFGPHFGRQNAWKSHFQ